MRYEVEEIKDFLIIHVIGDLTIDAHIKILDEAINEHINDGYHKFLFNLEKLENIDVDGIGIFINCLTDVEVHGGGCYILIEDDHVFDNLTRTGLDKLMTVYRNKDDFADDHNIIIPDEAM